MVLCHLPNPNYFSQYISASFSKCFVFLLRSFLSSFLTFAKHPYYYQNISFPNCLFSNFHLYTEKSVMLVYAFFLIQAQFFPFPDNYVIRGVESSLPCRYAVPSCPVAQQAPFYELFPLSSAPYSIPFLSSLHSKLLGFSVLFG